VVAAFASAIALGTLLLMLPVAREEAVGTSFVDALFTATSAVCVTGLIVVDTPAHWSAFGEWVILGLIQVGGFGIMTLATLLTLIVGRRLGLGSRMVVAAETKALGLGDVRSVLKGVLAVTVVFETATWLLLTLRLVLGYDETWSRASYLGLFHSVSAFNNAGFSLYSDSLTGFVTDPWICLPIAIAVIAGGLGVPVWMELYRHRTMHRRWNMHTRMTLWATASLLLLGTLFVTANEWRNPGTLGPLDVPGKLLAGFFQSVMPRTAGFNSLDYAEMREGTLLGTVALMFIGGGSAGTAGGIKVTTFVLLFFVIYAEVRGDRNVEAFDRRIDERAIRQALTVALLGVGVVVATALFVLETTENSTSDALFEAASAFGTVGISTGVTGTLTTSGELWVTAVMFLGRLGPVTLVSALALRDRDRLYQLPEGRPIIG
jgi:potassium uptake TrkH family protein